MDKIPVIKVLKTKDGRGYVFWCPFCDTFHCHGSVEGDRLPHCTNKNSPYIRTGYILKEYTKKEIQLYNLNLK